MTVRRLLEILFPETMRTLMKENDTKVFEVETHLREEYARTHQALVDGWKEKVEQEKIRARGEGYENAKKELEDPRRVMVSFGDELMFPMDFTDYNSDEEREAIASLVSTREYQLHFKHNIICQAMKKWRDARSQIDPQMMALFNVVGNQFLDLVYFYDNAAKPPEPEKEGIRGDSFSTLLDDDDA